MATLPPPRVLAVDDAPAVRELIVRVLEEVGYEVVAVPDDRSGLAAAAKARFDLVITNTYMPTLPGDQLIGHLRRLFPDLPILHLDDMRPFGIEALLRAVAGALNDRPYASVAVEGRTGRLDPPAGCTPGS